MFDRGEIAKNSHACFKPLGQGICGAPPFGQVGDDELYVSKLAGADRVVNFRYARGVRSAEGRHDLQAEPFTKIALVDTGDDRTSDQTGLGHAIRGFVSQSIKPFRNAL